MCLKLLCLVFEEYRLQTQRYKGLLWASFAKYKRMLYFGRFNYKTRWRLYLEYLVLYPLFDYFLQWLCCLLRNLWSWKRSRKMWNKTKYPTCSHITKQVAHATKKGISCDQKGKIMWPKKTHCVTKRVYHVTKRYIMWQNSTLCDKKGISSDKKGKSCDKMVHYVTKKEYHVTKKVYHVTESYIMWQNSTLCDQKGISSDKKGKSCDQKR